MRSGHALLCIDMQNDYFSGGAMELAAPEEAALKAATAIECFRAEGLPVIHIAHESVRAGSTFFLPGSDGQRIHALVRPVDDERIITKHYPNSFLQTQLLTLLQELSVTNLAICGMMTHMCIDATTRAAKDLGFSCTLVHDATATKDLTFAGMHVAAVLVQAAFTAALSSVCDAVCTAGELVQRLPKGFDIPPVARE